MFLCECGRTATSALPTLYCPYCKSQAFLRGDTYDVVCGKWTDASVAWDRANREALQDG